MMKFEQKSAPARQWALYILAKFEYSIERKYEN